MPMVHRLAPPASADRMGVVEADQSFARRPVKRERIIEAVRLLRGCRNAGDDELHPMAALGIDKEHLSVEVQKRVEARITMPAHVFFLSVCDRNCKLSSGFLGSKSSSNTSPNQPSNTSISASVTGMSSGQSSITRILWPSGPRSGVLPARVRSSGVGSSA